MATSGRNTPDPIKRLLRQEAHFGCALCGCPILAYHHIVPYHLVRAFDPSDMIALCPTHHHRADRGEYSEQHLRNAKTNPHNKTTVSDAFFLESGVSSVNVASNTFKETPRILAVDDFDIISIRMEKSIPLLNINIFDHLNNWIGVVHENNWTVDTSLLWDVEYTPRHLVIRNRPRNIALDASIKNDTIFIMGNLYFNGYPVEMKERELHLGGRGKMTVTNCTFTRVGCALDLHTR